MDNTALLKSKLWPLMAKEAHHYLVERHRWEETNKRTLISQNAARTFNELSLLLYVKMRYDSRSVYVQSCLRDIKRSLSPQ